MMDKDTAIEVTQALTGRCYPYGDTAIDEKRYESLLLKIWVASSLIDEIYEAGELYDRHEFSIQHISNRANQYLTELRDTLCEIEYLPPVEEIEESHGEKQVTSKLNNADDSLLTADLEGCKEQKSMSVLIKNMEMPKCCGECHFCHTENFRTWCCPTGREDVYYDSIPEWCPLEEQKSKLETVGTPTNAPTNAPTDFISRQAAINAIENTDVEITAEEWDELANAIESLPPAEPKRPKGEWITTPYPDSDEVIDMAIEALQGDMYCPSCGVRLVSENEYVEPKPYKESDGE